MVAHRQVYGGGSVTTSDDNNDNNNEENKPRRPNANYKLSNIDKGEGAYEERALNFHYNRENRLAKAPQMVRELYTNPLRQDTRFNLFRPLVADKPRAIIFFTILFLCAMIFVLSALDIFTDSYKLGGNKIEVTANIFEETTLFTIRKTVKDKAEAYTGAVDIAVSPVETGEVEQYRVFRHRIFFSTEPVEEYRIVAPYDEPEQWLVLQSERSTLNIKIKPE